MGSSAGSSHDRPDARRPHRRSADPPDDCDDLDPSPVLAFSTDDVRVLLHAAANPQPPHRSSWPVWDVAMLTLAARCGTRVSEPCELPSRHVVRCGELAQLYLVDRTKRGRRRQVPVPGDTITAIHAWLSERAERLGDTMLGDPLFVRNDGGTVDRFFCDRLVRRCACKAVSPSRIGRRCTRCGTTVVYSSGSSACPARSCSSCSDTPILAPQVTTSAQIRSSSSRSYAMQDDYDLHRLTLSPTVARAFEGKVGVVPACPTMAQGSVHNNEPHRIVVHAPLSKRKDTEMMCNSCGSWNNGDNLVVCHECDASLPSNQTN